MLAHYLRRVGLPCAGEHDVFADQIRVHEREDLGDATALLVATEPFAVTQNLAQAWFDQQRDY